MRSFVVVLGVVVGLLLVGCTTADVTPSASVTTLTPDAERWFRLSWEPVPEKNGRVRLRGYLENTYGEPAGKVQLLAQALDTREVNEGGPGSYKADRTVALVRRFYEG